ncbi:type II secretion system protein F, partial [Cryobacterium sp. 10I1]|nr:type II secretion system protein F [Cryobacterium sp. 10I1]
PWIVLLLLSSRPEGAVAYNTGSGVAVIVSGLVVSVIAYRLMVFIGRLPEERRWFR